MSRHEASPTFSKRTGRPFAFALAFATVALSLGIASCGDSPDASRVIATVNGHEITHGDLMKELKTQYGAETLMASIDEELVRSEAGERGLSISEDERQGGLERAAARVGSMDDLKRKLQQSQTSMDTYLNELEIDLLLDKIVRQEIIVPDEDIKEYYDGAKAEFERGQRVRARMIFFLDEDSAKVVRDILNDPKADFAGLASSLSEDETTKAEGGDMGYFEKDDYAKAISDKAFSMEPGQISDVIKVPDGWVILKIEDRKPAGALPLEEVSDQIRQRIIRERLVEARQKWLVDQRENSKVKVPDKTLSAAFEALKATVKPPPMPGQL